MNKTQLVELVRNSLGDYAEENRIIGYKPEFTHEDYLKAIEASVRDFNIRPPMITAYSIPRLPATITNIIVNGAIYHLLSRGIFKKARNFVGIRDDGIYVNAEENINLYIKLLDFTKRQFEESCDNLKASMNIESLL